MERKHQQTEFEAERPGVLERSYTDFEQEYRQYKLCLLYTSRCV